MSFTSCDNFGRILDRNRMFQIVYGNGGAGNLKSFFVGNILDSLGQTSFIKVIVGPHHNTINVFALCSVGIEVRISKLVLS